MRITIYQPRYFPQLHYFNRIFSADTFVLLDNAQYTKALVHIGEKKVRLPSYQSDTPIKTATGTYLLTIPIQHRGLPPISKTYIANVEPWNLKHLATIKSAYSPAPFYKDLSQNLDKLLRTKYQTLGQLNIATIIWAMDKLLNLKLPELTLPALNSALQKNRQVRLKRVLTSEETGVKRPDGQQKGTEWTAAICKALDATEYYHGGTAKSGYMKFQYYSGLGIRPIEQNWKCIAYPQQFAKKNAFIPNLSILDLLLNVDRKTAQKIVT